MRLLLALLTASTLALAGCASDDDGHADHDDGSSHSSSSTGPAAVPAPQTHVVSLVSTDFEPGDITIARGDTVRWVHEDGAVPHNVESSDPAFDSHPDCTVAVPGSPLCMTDGDEFTYTFTELGVVEYLCQVHNGMTGKLTVVEPGSPGVQAHDHS